MKKNLRSLPKNFKDESLSPKSPFGALKTTGEKNTPNPGKSDTPSPANSKNGRGRGGNGKGVHSANPIESFFDELTKEWIKKMGSGIEFTSDKNTAKPKNEPEKLDTPSPAKSPKETKAKEESDNPSHTEQKAEPSISIKERTAEHIIFGCSFKKVAGRLNPILKGIGKCLSPEDLKVVEKCLSRQLFEACSANGTNGTVKVFLKKGKKLIKQEERIREAAEARVKKAIDLFSGSKTKPPDNGWNGNGNGKKNKANHHHSDCTMKDLKKMRNGGGARATK